MAITTNYQGLTALEVVQQSAIIHPDWDDKMHHWYLVTEEIFSDDEAIEAVAKAKRTGVIL